MLIDLVGLPQEQAGLVLAVYGITGVVINGVIIALGARPAWEIPIMVAGIVCYGAAALGLLLAPGWMPWVWVVVAGLGPLAVAGADGDDALIGAGAHGADPRRRDGPRADDGPAQGRDGGVSKRAVDVLRQAHPGRLSAPRSASLVCAR